MKYIGRTFLSLMIILCALTFSSCKKDYICPAYQSYYLLDSASRYQYFSLFVEDSLPKEIVEVKKSKVGVMEKMSYRKKAGSLNTLPMTIVYPQIADTATVRQDSVEMMIGTNISENQ